MEEVNKKNNHKIGSITVITGNMFSGKTGLLIAKYNQSKNYRKCLVFKPVLDNRYSETEIVSHDKDKIKAIPINSIQDIERYKDQGENIYIDEIHFFKEDVNTYLNNLANQNKEIVVAGGSEKYGSYCRFHYKPVSKTTPNKNKNSLIIIAGGSGTGKTTVEALLSQDPNITKLISTTTRPKREGEEHGKDYYFISKEEFETELEKGRFLEHVIYDGNYYGVHGKVIDLVLGTQRKNGVIIVDVEGFRQIKKYCQEKGYNAISYWFKSESMEKMVEHMKKRGTSEPEIIRRLIIEEKEGKFSSEFDYILTVKEGGLAEAVQEIKEKLKNYEVS
ncbi:9945_t:CDS:2 [Paraglomus brasilianum]|uniref:thymidine kinase n=1 Tax=Paraglomus brasilianum TaxID=144538 RepID=A0A9N9BM73_9GLOM|nr:9945_t:CDS:2 [Paraglomus brasilianum]